MPLVRVVLIPVFLAAFGWADTASDRSAIEGVVASVLTVEKSSNVFTAGADGDLDRLKDLNRRLVAASRQVWSELPMPGMLVEAIRFVTPDVALVNAANAQYGAAMLTRIPVLFVMKKEGTEWKIASLRLLGDPATRR
jgi:hypothetical protein